MFEIPNFVGWFESAKNAGLERAAANAFVSAAASAWIAGMWRSGTSKWAVWFGEGQALQDAATAAYLTLSQLETKDFLVLTVPQDMLVASNLSKFQTERMTK
jgi:hypothetical protein